MGSPDKGGLTVQGRHAWLLTLVTLCAGNETAATDAVPSPDVCCSS